MFDSYFSICMHHGGQFIGENVDHYTSEEVHIFPNCNGNKLTLRDVKGLIRELGYTTYKGLWYMPPQTKSGLLPLSSESDVIDMTGVVFGCDEVHVYIDNGLNDCHGVDVCQRSDTISREAAGIDGLEGGHCLDIVKDVGGRCVDDEENVSVDSVANVDFKSDCKQILEDVDVNFDWELHYSDSDEVRSFVDSSDDEFGAREDTFTYPYDPKNVKFKVGMLFPSVEIFKQALVDYAVYENRDIRFKCEKTRLRASCHKPCQWVIYGSVIDNGRAIQVKTFSNKHTCPKTYRIRNMSANWIAKNFVSTVRSQPDMKTTTVQSEVNERYGVGCSRSKAFRAKQLALKLAEGDYVEQYGMVRDYCEEVLRTNPGSTCVVQCSFNPDIGSSNTAAPRFERLYVCLYACKKGFVDGCRPLIGIDGCHLKGPCGGILLSAVGMDANNRVFPIAVAAVESENKDSWGWFLNLLLADIGTERQWTFTSDQQKGLVPALAERVPSLEHRLCVRHLHGNLKKQHPGLQLRNLMYAAAKSTYSQAFEANMKRIMELNKGAFDWLSKLDPKAWTKSAFSCNAKNDTITNNLSESYNAIIIDAREKPIITMFEAMRTSLMTKFQENREKASQWKGHICPHYTKKIEKLQREHHGWITRFAGHDKFEVSGPYHQFIVDTRLRTCSCRRWDLTGVPCVHAVTAMFHIGVSPLDYVDEFYSIDAYRRCYAYVINPINGRDMWPHSVAPRPLPPIYQKQPGRPKKARRRDVDEAPAEGKLSKKNKKMKCRQCNEVGHNKRGCKHNKKQDATHATPYPPRADTPPEVAPPEAEIAVVEVRTPRRRSAHLQAFQGPVQESHDPITIDLRDD